jgi:hypothetical protein
MSLSLYSPRFSKILSAQLHEQRLSFLEVGRSKTFGDPAIDRSQQLTGFDLFALAPP